MATRTLILLRHAKSDYPDGVADHERPLAKRGIREAALAGDWIREHLPSVDAVLCSTATRTRQTWAAAMEGGACGETVEFSDSVYSGGAETVLRSVRESAGEAQVVMVVGHNPTLAWLLHQLTRDHRGLSTGTLVGIDLVGRRLLQHIRPQA